MVKETATGKVKAMLAAAVPVHRFARKPRTSRKKTKYQELSTKHQELERQQTALFFLRLRFSFLFFVETFLVLL